MLKVIFFIALFVDLFIDRFCVAKQIKIRKSDLKEALNNFYKSYGICPEQNTLMSWIVSAITSQIQFN